jgi:hypothetical protein
MTTQPHPASDVDSRAAAPPHPNKCSAAESGSAATTPTTVGVTMRPDVLGWTAQRGCITAPHDLLAAARAGETVLVVDDDHVLRGVEGDVPLVAAIRGDNDAVDLREQISGLAARIDDMHDRLMDLAEASVEVLTRR